MVSANRYTEVHLRPQGPGDARPTALQIIHDEGLQGQLTGKTILITGTSSGLGLETVRALASTGATIFCAARNPAKNEAALADIQACSRSSGGRLELLEADLSSLASVRIAAADFLSRSGGRLNILINNAGVMGLPQKQVSVDGVELQFATNHLGHFLLFVLLREALLASATSDMPSRVVNVSSAAHRFSGIHPGNYNLGFGLYNPWVAYGQSKTARIYMATAIERRYGGKGLHGLAVNPGTVFTGAQRHLDDEYKERWMRNEKQAKCVKSVEQGAATTVLAAVGKEFEGRGAVYIQDCGEWGPAGTIDFGPDKQGYAPHAFDFEMEERLWVDSCRMVGVPED